MARTVKLRKGFNIRLEGKAEKVLTEKEPATFFAVKPLDFPGLVPKLDVKPGDDVLAGTSLFHNKLRPGIKFTSPVSGKVVAVERGERRQIQEVVVERNGDFSVDFGREDLSGLRAEEIKEKLMASGLWPSIRQRPYHIVANPMDKPKSLFISGFDTAPLAPDYSFIMDNVNESFFRTGIMALSKLTDGRINLVLEGGTSPTKIFSETQGVEISYFSGPHPAGNVGVHIHHIDPVNRGEVVWYVNIQDVAIIGRLFREGIYRPERIIALTGSSVINRQYYTTISGGSVTPFLIGNVKPGHNRFISGNVLTGTKIRPEGFPGFYDSQVTVIPEGDHSDFFGWASPGLRKFSFSGTFLSGLFPRKEYTLDTNLNGGLRAFVITGQYEKVVPMDIFPMHLFKAIISEDIEMMENLGIYEVAEEDFALCEYICPSKIEIQSLVRKGIDLMIKEMN